MFSKIYLEITSVCNLACDFCPPTQRAKQFLTLDKFQSYLEKLQGHGSHLYFHLKGEPLLHPLLGEFLKLAGEQGFRVTLTTNGTLVEAKASVLLGATSLKQLNISLHSHAGIPNLGTYWAGVCSFLDRHDIYPGFPVSLRLWNRKQGVLPPPAQDLWDLIEQRYPQIGSWDDSQDLPKGLKLAEKVYLNQEEQFTWPDLSLVQDEGPGFCYGLRNQVGILCDGRVVPCCLDGEGIITLGNLNTQSLEEILGSPRARDIYEGFTQRKVVEPLCRTCGYRRKFISVQQN